MSFNDAIKIMLPSVGNSNVHITANFNEPRSSGPHGGVDFNYIGGQTGINLTHPTIYSPVSGTVTFVGGQYGTIKIIDANGNSHEILHTNSQFVKAGDSISAGEQIGTMGGRGPGGADQYAQHVHYQIKNAVGSIINPQQWWESREPNLLDNTPTTDPTTLNQTPSTSTTNKFGGESLRDFIDNLNTKDATKADNKIDTASTNTSSAPTQTTTSEKVVVLRVGSEGTEVTKLQGMLKALGYDIEVDGIYGDKTKLVVEKYQIDKGLDLDGVAGKDTLKSVNEAFEEKRSAEEEEAYASTPAPQDATPTQEPITTQPTTKASGVSYDGSDAEVQYATYNPSDIPMELLPDAQKQALADYFRANNISGDDIYANTTYNPLTGRLIYNDPEKGGISVDAYGESKKIDASGAVVSDDQSLSDAQLMSGLYDKALSENNIDTSTLSHYTDSGMIKTDGTGIETVNMGNSTIYKDSDGNILAESITDFNGVTTYTFSDGTKSYIDQNGQLLTEKQYTEYQWSQAAGALGLTNSIIGLQNWSKETVLQQAATVATIYNQIDNLGGDGVVGADNLPGNLGGLAAGLGLISAIQSGNTQGIITGGLSLASYGLNAYVSSVVAEAGKELAIVAAENATVAAASTAATAMSTAIPYVNLAFAVANMEENPWGVVAAAAAFIPVYGVAISLAITIASSLFGGSETPNLPMSEGHAHAIWDESSPTISVVTDQDSHNGGPTANGWMSNMLSSIQTYLAGQVDASGNPLYDLIPARVPSIGFIYDPDGFNYSSATGHLTLTWTDDNGASQTRYYNGQGSRMDGGSVEGMAA